MSVRKRSLPRGWYPYSESQCREQIDGFLKDFKAPVGKWLGGVAPHAGWDFSGRGAARVFSTIASGSNPDCVVVYGGHLSGYDYPIIYTERHWETPLGQVAMESALVNDIVRSGAVRPVPSDFSDNTVEVLLPFLRFFFPKASLVAIHAPSSEKAIGLGGNVAAVFKAKNVQPVFIGSADLTHYGPNYGFMPMGTGGAAVRWVREENDRSIIERALSMDAEGVLYDASTKHNTCSPGPIASVIASVLQFGVNKGTLLEYYTSHDILPGSSFVGYACIVY